MTFSTEDKIVRGPEGSVPLPDGLARYLFGKMLQHGDKVAQVGRFWQHEMRHVLAILRPRVLVADKPNALYEQSATTVLSRADVFKWFEGEASDAAVPQAEAEVEVEVEERPLDSPAVVLCSSGTTGYPKGVEVSHRGLLQLLAIGTEKKLMMMLGDGSFLVLSPAFWVSAVALLLLSINAGSRIVAMAQFKESLFLKALREHKTDAIVTSYFTEHWLQVVGTLMAPFLGVKLLRMSPQPDLTPLRLIVFGGSALDRVTQAQLQAKFKLAATQMYGMTELLMTLSSESTKPSPFGSVGLPQPNVEVKVVDTESGHALGPNQDGELCFRAPTVTRGYYNDPVATAAAIDADGWFHTGDVGYYDDAGHFYITDRIKDFVKYKGHHVSSVLLEGLLYKHPAVLEAAVVGVPDPLAAELPRAYVALKSGEQVSAEELANFVNAEVSDHKKLRGGVVFLEKLPRTSTGKVCKRILRELAKKEESGN
ncbi:uncharacterized protein LOC126413175 [Schistocerca serialis cubense]|uniref:uncharacterized protein LOC126413175 n=1 Tax=Schistocerca serialis cubense TaxID=2023355 RepID=UPI00214E2FF5|nr:uncharacterized protein LOC126413175 [Schistocerca serialis cubense]